MTVSKTVIRAYADRYRPDQVQTFLDAALDAHAQNLPRVEMTAANFKEGGNSGQWIEGDPEQLIELFQKVLDYQRLDQGEGIQRNRLMNHGDFSCRAVGW